MFGHHQDAIERYLSQGWNSAGKNGFASQYTCSASFHCQI